ncbi:MAG: hypothetical protein DI544_00145 [Sphingomonas taxi]|uniref:DUF2336 domain-containing protein n=1 Tax=Sphingomonas taxi TaxID=1549858 RepID=A0A2W5PIT0_9SPHN|nr:MAG: hypothetical protein DI544_00145 [Sphingomonas taxi]
MSATFPHASAPDDPARWENAERAAEARLAVAVEDIFLSQPGRLDDRTRSTVLRLAETTVEAIERQVAGDAGRALAARGLAAQAASLESNHALAWPRLLDAGLMRDAELIGELIAQARVDLLDESLVLLRAPDAGATLLTTLTDSADPELRQLAAGYLAADGRRWRNAGERCAALPPVLHHRLTWWVAAALRERMGRAGEPESDRALCDAAQRCIGAHRGVEHIGDVAARLATALVPATEDLADLLLRALESARTTLFVALLAQALAIEAAEARALVLDSASDRLWLALRAAGVPRDAIARIGFLLAEADRERDLDTLIAMQDDLAALSPASATQAVAALALPRDFRRAMRALTRQPPP